MQWQYEYQVVVCVLSAVRRTALNAHTTNKLILPLHTNNFNGVLTDDFKETVTLARLHRMLPDDGP